MYKCYRLETREGNVMLTYSIDLYSKDILRIFSTSKRQKIMNIEPGFEKQYSSKEIECIVCHACVDMQEKLER